MLPYFIETKMPSTAKLTQISELLNVNKKMALQVMKNTEVTEKTKLLWNFLKFLSESKQQ